MVCCWLISWVWCKCNSWAVLSVAQQVVKKKKKIPGLLKSSVVMLHDNTRPSVVWQIKVVDFCVMAGKFWTILPIVLTSHLVISTRLVLSSSILLHMKIWHKEWFYQQDPNFVFVGTHKLPSCCDTCWITTAMWKIKGSYQYLFSFKSVSHQDVLLLYFLNHPCKVVQVSGYGTTC